MFVQRRVSGLSLMLLCLSIASAFSAMPVGYSGKPWGGAALPVPGKFYVDRADSGALNVAYYHPNNVGYTGMLKMTGIDPAADCILPGFANDVVINPGDIYWAYIEAGEWMKVTINVAVAGAYQVNMQMTNGRVPPQKCAMLTMVYDGTDSITSDTMNVPYFGKCGQWDFHSWFVAKGLDTLTLKAGLQVLRVQTGDGPINVRWIELKALSTPVQSLALRPAGAGMRLINCIFTNGTISVRFSSPDVSPANLGVFDLKGNLICSQPVADVVAGENIVSMNRGLAAGVYLVRISQAGRVVQEKLQLYR